MEACDWLCVLSQSVSHNYEEPNFFLTIIRQGSVNFDVL